MDRQAVHRQLGQVIGKLTPPPDHQSIEGLTWLKPREVITKGKLAGIKDPRIIAGCLLVLMMVMYFILR